MISFIHLSDIHFTKHSNDYYDVDEDLRNEIKLDIIHYFPLNVNPQGILICGDIAYSGQSKEYDIASQFINEICDIIKIPKFSVFCVPGNHDVNRNIPEQHPAVKSLQDYLAKCSTLCGYNDALSKVFRSDISSKILYLPIENYNNFSKQYGCNLTTSKYQWEQRIEISKNYQLCILGLNSTVISNADDHATDNERLMKMSDFQIPQREDNTIFLTLCHHPPECWDDPDKVLRDKLNSRIHLQLYGHKHIQTIENYDKTIIIGSGAMHPSRWEPNWIPRYNWISIDIITENGNNFLIIKIYPRIYNLKECQFQKDHNIVQNNDYVMYKLPLGNTNIATNDFKTIDEVYDSPNNIEKSSIEWSKQFIYDFINLPKVSRDQILHNLNLYCDAYNGKSHTDILLDIVCKAEEKQCVDALINEINKYK